jgi:mycoredoxin
MFCDRLKLGLGSARHDVSWVDISKDAEAAEFVASHRDGEEIVPTAVTGAGEMIDATPGAIRAQLRAAGPER